MKNARSPLQKTFLAAAVLAEIAWIAALVYWVASR